jgi:hypothetical protein
VDYRRRARVGLARALGVGPQQRRWVMPAAGRDRMDWHAGVKERRFVAAS